MVGKLICYSLIMKVFVQALFRDNFQWQTSQCFGPKNILISKLENKPQRRGGAKKIYNRNRYPLRLSAFAVAKNVTFSLQLHIEQ